MRAVERKLAGVGGGVSVAHRQVDLVQQYRTRLLSDIVTGKLDVRAAVAGLPALDPLATEDDRDLGSSAEALSDGEELGVTGKVTKDGSEGVCRYAVDDTTKKSQRVRYVQDMRPCP